MTSSSTGATPSTRAATLLRRAIVALTVVLLLALCVDAGVSAGAEGFGFGTLLRIGLVLGGC
jgi:hypothetical protein